MARSAARVRLLPPRREALPAPLEDPDPIQREALERAAAGERVLVHGRPGSGRTSLVLSAALADPQEPCWILAPRRGSAAALADALAVHGGGTAQRALTPAAVAHAIVREAALADGQGEPTLVTGADQDALLAELISVHEPWHLRAEPGARTLLAFRTELRDVITRALELGLSPGDLQRLAAERGRPAWLDAAAIMRAYLEVLALESSMALDAGPRLDAGGIVRRAADLLAQRPDLRRPRRLLVDDAQDLTPSALDLIAALAVPGRPLLVTSAPDATVESFRGALPDAGARLAVRLGDAHGPASGAVTALALPGAYRGGAQLRHAIDDLRARLPLAGAPASQRRPADPQKPGSGDPDSADKGGLAVLTLPSALDEARAIAGALRDLHHREGLPYEEMAVICRSGGAVDALADLLARHDLPVSTAARLRPLREEPVVLDLLRILEAALGGGEPLGPEEVLTLLRGPFGDADALRLRRVRRLLLAADPDGAASSAQMLLETVLGERDLPASRDRSADPVVRLRAMIAAVRDLGPAPAPIDALWAAWEAAGLAEGWRWAALDPREADGARARLTSGRLDAVAALFAAAERFTERRPEADALVLVDHVRAQAVAEDTLAPRAAVAGRVAVLTAPQIAGEQRTAVVLAGLQEGAWPNVRLRSSLFGAAELSLLHLHPDLPRGAAALRAVQREDVLDGELRLTISALARATRYVLATAVEDAETAPSALHAALARATGLDPAVGGGWLTREQALADPGPAPDARRLVSALRRRAVGEDPVAAAHAAALLHRLAREQVPGADPAEWYHQRPSSVAPVRGEGPLVLSPSALERAEACPQAWLLERSGGTPSRGAAQSIGTAIHRIAQEHPDGQVPDLLGRLHALLAPLHLEDTWSGRRALQRAEETAQRTVEHLRSAPPALAVEAPFRVQVGQVVLRGIIDRIEGDQTSLRVVDLKTGRTAKSAAATETDLQLAAYQTAVREGALAAIAGDDAPERLSGAQLVHVGTGTRRATVRTQPPIETAADPDWFTDLVARVEREASGPAVPARRNAHCDRCPVRRSCALMPDGAEL